MENTLERLSGILSIAADAIISVDDTFRIVFFNQGAEATFGYRAPEVLGRPLDILLPERFRTAHQAHITAFGRSASPARLMGERQTILALHKDGREFPAEASISKLDVGGGRLYTAVLRDVTERKEIEAQLEHRVAERTAELTALLGALPDGVIKIDQDMRIALATATLERMTGYGQGELTGHRCEDLCNTPQDVAAMLKAWDSETGSGSPAPSRVGVRRKDGSSFPAVVVGRAVRDMNGAIAGRVAVVRDISVDLEQQKALAISQRMETFGQLTGGIAHDFNNLLAVIMGNLELLAMRPLGEKERALVARADEAAQMGARLTERLLTFARRRPLTPKTLNLNDLITALVDLLRRSIGEHIELNTSLTPHLPLIHADASEIENAVLNLAINARDAMPRGGSITIETAEHVVAEGAPPVPAGLAPGLYVRLSVRDTGCGMNAAVQARAFEPFFTTKQPGKGTGLGLSTIYGSVKHLGGMVTLTSTPGAGTVVDIYLPHTNTPAADEAAERPTGPLPLSAGERVLLVEDDPGVREIARQRLEDLGYVVAEAENGPSAIEILKSGAPRFDLVLADILMPGGMTGYDVAEWVLANCRGTRVLLTSGYAGDALDVRPGLPVTPPLLRKPYSREALARTVRAALDAD